MEKDRFENWILKKFEFISKLNSEKNDELLKIARMSIVQELTKFTSSTEFQNSLLTDIINNSKKKLSNLESETSKLKIAISSLEKRQALIMQNKKKQKAEILIEKYDKIEPATTSNDLNTSTVLSTPQLTTQQILDDDDDFDITEIESLLDETQPIIQEKSEKKSEMIDLKKIKKENAADLKPKLSRKRKGELH